MKTFFLFSILMIYILTSINIYSQLSWCTYIDIIDQDVDMKIDNAGNTFVTSGTRYLNYPTTSGAYDTSYNGNDDIIISKINSLGSNLIFSTFIGGDSVDMAHSIGIDKFGNSYITGYTYSSNYPITANAFDDSFNDTNNIWPRGDCFVTKLNSVGTALIYSTFIGGNRDDKGYDIVIDSINNAILTGYTTSVNFPITSGAYDIFFNDSCILCNGSDCFVTKINSTGSSIIFSTFIGGSRTDGGTSIILDKINNYYITGFTKSSDFPTTLNSFSSNYPSRYFNNFITKLNSTGSSLIYSTYIGGYPNDYSSDQPYSIAVDNICNPFITGSTPSITYPVTIGAYDTAFNGGLDIFVTKLNASGSALFYSTFLGSSYSDCGYSIILDSNNNSLITGQASNGYPITNDAFNETNSGMIDCIISKLNYDGTGLIYSTFFGGRLNDFGFSIAIDRNNSMYIAGRTQSDNMPTTSNVYNRTYSGNGEIFIAKFDNCIGTPNIQTINPITFPDLKCSSFINDTFYISNSGSCYLSLDSSYFNGSNPTEFSIISPFIPATIPPKDSLKFIVRFTPNILGNKTATLKLVNNSSVNPFLINLTGTFLGGEPQIQSINSIFYPVVCVSSYQEDTFYVHNKGTCNLNLSSLTFDGTDSLEFIKLSPILPVDIPVNDSVRFIVRFVPLTQGNKSSNLNISNNSKNSKYQINLIGTAKIPVIQSIDSIGFSSVVCSNVRQDTIIIHNVDSCILTLLGSTIIGTNSSEFSIVLPKTFPVNIQPNDSIKFIVRYTPNNIFGTKSATLSLTNNSANNPYTINLTAKNDSIAYKINNSESDTLILDIGNICPGSDKDTTITIFNKSSTGTTFKIENVDPQLKIREIDKAGKGKGDMPEGVKKKKK
jgi:hypothetical protein